MTHPRRPPVPLAVLGAVAAAVLVLTALPAAAELRIEPRSSWIVVLKPGATVHPPRDVQVTHVYRAAFNGYSALMTAGQAARIRADRATEQVVPDRAVPAEPAQPAGLQASGQATPTGIDRIDAEKFGGALPVPRVRVAVIDTGIDGTHPDLAGLVVGGVDCIGDGWGTRDPHGHGTHVAGTIAARYDTQGVFGVLPGVQLLSVRVVGANNFGTWAQWICGIDWVTANAAALNIKVANMSLGGPAAWGPDDGKCGQVNGDLVHKAICASVAAGVTYVVGAGNSNTNLRSTLPASYREVIAVTALADSDGRPGRLGPATEDGPDDTFASFSNFAVSAADRAHTVGAPGVDILSTLPGGAYARWDGTSMAAPHVTGVVAKRLSFLAGLGMTATPAQMLKFVRSTGEPLGFGHADPSGLHPEPVVNATGLPPR